MLPRMIAILCVAILIPLPCFAQPPAPEREPTYRGKALRAWVKDLESKELLIQVRALNTLMAEAGPEAQPAVPALIAVFGNRDNPILSPLAAVALSKIGTPAIPDLVKGLEAKDHLTRSGSALALGMMGEKGRRAVPALVKALGDDESLVRATAAGALGQIGSTARPALPDLRERLKDTSPSVRLEAAEALWTISALADESVPVLAALLEKGPADLRGRAASVLGKMGTQAKAAEPALLKAMKAEDLGLRPVAARALYQVTGQTRRPLAVLASALEAKEPTVRRQALRALEPMVRVPGVAMLLARTAFRDAEVDLRRTAARSLAQIDKGSTPLQKLLYLGLWDKDPVVRWWLAVSLLAIQPADAEVNEAILRALRDGIAEVRKPGSLVDLPGTVGSRAVPPLVQALKSRHDRLRKLAIACLGLLGAEAGSAVPALIAVFSDRDEEIRNLAADALARIGPAAVPALLKATRDSAGPVRAAAYRALGQVGPPDLATRTALRRGLRDADIEVRVQTAVALWRVGVGGQEPVKLLVAMLDDSDEGAASAAVTALAEIHLASGGSQPEVTEALVKTLKQRDTRLKLVALQALWRVDREERVVLPLMREALTDRNPLVRKRAVALLGELGRDARVGGLLLEALEERDPRVREEALAALTRRGEAALPALEKALDHERSRIRLGALEVIARLGPQAARLREKVIKAGRDKDSRVRKAAEVALLQIEPQDAKEFLKLLRLLEEIEKKERESKDRP